MERFIQLSLYLHIFVGGISLISGAFAILTKKGGAWHKRSGKIYFFAMTMVFITGILVAGYRMNKFLFLIAFLSYYSVFSGVRILQLKGLHKGQKATWFDWTAGLINLTANLFFVALSIYIYLNGANLGAVLLTLGFGMGGVFLSYINLTPFIKKPEIAYHWYSYHIGNMMGGYIATFTAFLSTMVTRFELMNPFLAFALPSLIGVPLLWWWTSQINSKFKNKSL